MPIEIRELVIRATVDPKAEALAGGCGSPSSKAGEKSTSRLQGGADDDVVQSCVREVLRILEDKRER
jgi:Family of unknown function (DUF5908)